MFPAQYLSERVSKVILDSDKVFNEGCRILAHTPNWQDLIDEIVDTAWDTLMKYALRNKSSTYSATVKLTFASNLIGSRIAKIINYQEMRVSKDADKQETHLLELEEVTPKTTLTLGDLLLETFLQANLIEIEREYDGFKAPYIVRVINMEDSIKPTLIGTTYEPLPPITGLFSPLTKEPFIKGWNNNNLFKEYLDTPFVKALECLRQQAWEINTDVLEVLKATPPKEYLEVIDEDGVIYNYNIHKVDGGLSRSLKLNHIDNTNFLGKADPKLQKAISKYFEYEQVVKKAKLVHAESKPFYQEISCDYRGRIYYAESFLEFQGSDIARSLFLFSNKKQVTEKGFRWLAIHTANCYNQSYTINELAKEGWHTTDYASYLNEQGLDTISVDKMTLDDRVNWTMSHLDSIKSCTMLETDAEKPYSFYACCMEIQKYIMAEIRGEKYLSGLPIPVDGSNNGWAHLASMSKDRQAGALVSLTNEPIQKDFYVAVAKELLKIMPDWFEDRNIPMKHIRKGISKRGSMTRAYSAGMKRIAKNMYDDCHMEGFTQKYNISEDDCFKLSKGLIQAINTVCAGPLKTTKYLQKIAEHELNEGRNYLTWVTPSNFPVIYKAYLQHEHKQRGTIKGIKGNKDGRVQHVIKLGVKNKETGLGVPCRRSFASGISPNVVHSYDAAHMANTIVAFGGNFAAVHDSFSTHADEVDFLVEVTKMTFIAQYDVENFFDLLQDNLMQYKDTFNFEQPKLGKLDINEVTNSDYFFC